jgi:hypothetical protein
MRSGNLITVEWDTTSPLPGKPNGCWIKKRPQQLAAGAVRI